MGLKISWQSQPVTKERVARVQSGLYLPGRWAQTGRCAPLTTAAPLGRKGPDAEPRGSPRKSLVAGQGPDSHLELSGLGAAPGWAEEEGCLGPVRAGGACRRRFCLRSR